MKDMNLRNEKLTTRSIRKLMICSLVAASFSLLGQAFAAGGSDAGSGTNSGGGGVTIDLDQHPRLRDFVDPSACRYIRARDFQKKYVPQSQNIIDQIKTAHWYLGDAYEREIDRLKVCMTDGPLKEVDVTDKDSVAIFQPKKLTQRQLAVRINEKIYIDMTILSQMQVQAEKDFGFIHEVTHSFLPLSVPQRNDSLRSYILMLSDKISESSLALNIEANHLDMPITTQELDPLKKEIIAALNPRTRPLIAVNSYVKIREILPILWGADQLKLTQINSSGVQISVSLEDGICNSDEDDASINKLKLLYKNYDMLFTDEFPQAWPGLTPGPDGSSWDLKSELQTTGLSMSLRPRYRDNKYSMFFFNFFLNDMNVIPGLIEMRALADRIKPNGTYDQVVKAILGSDSTLETMAEQIIAKIPKVKLVEYAKDKKVAEAPILLKMISKRLNSK